MEKQHTTRLVFAKPILFSLLSFLFFSFLTASSLFFFKWRNMERWEKQFRYRESNPDLLGESQVF